MKKAVARVKAGSNKVRTRNIIPPRNKTTLRMPTKEDNERRLAYVDRALNRRGKELDRGERLMPLEVLLSAMDYGWTNFLEEKDKKKPNQQALEKFHALATNAASIAAPYIHPKLQAIKLFNADARDPDELSDQQLLAIIEGTSTELPN